MSILQRCWELIPILLYLQTHPESHIITTKNGDLRGQNIIVGSTEVYSYLGIPYAVPPVGELRFKESEPVGPWKGVFDATKLPPLCWQHFTPPLFEWYPVANQNFNEDCLYLNIWVPRNEKDHGKKAVMVWIHGGGFFSGSASQDVYEGKNLAAQGNVIVVSLNYRLGPFGFLYSGTEDAPGNMGLKDQTLALRWIKDNIEAFGGDPTKITVFGNSAGSISLSSHLLSPLTRGLFQQAILQSGTAYQRLFTRNTTEARLFSDEFASIVDCASRSRFLPTNPSEMVDCLRKLPASEIALADRKIAGHLSVSFVPMYGDDYLPKSPIKELNAGNIHDVAIFIGNVEDEGSFFLGLVDPRLLDVEWPIITMNQAAEYIENLFQSINNPSSNVIVGYYLKNVLDKDSSLLLKRVYDSIGDYLLYCPSVFVSEISSKYGLKVYHYILNHRRAIAPTRAWEGVQHFEEVPFIFGTHLFPGHRFTAVDVEFSKRIMEAWTSFAKTGKPNSEPFGIEEWPLYKENPFAIELNPYQSQVKSPYKPACHFWKQYF